MKVKHLGSRLYLMTLTPDQQRVVDGQAKYEEVEKDVALGHIVSGAIDPFIFISKHVGSIAFSVN